ncbi:putative peroxisomal acyl-coenzyme A oxidase [Zancudomyces culisetae]|uniref:Putative peroxisomal acyl-coenzyme A oxidase n=1 Tax=Zancudomyces culisetae TaxID=1213189 RepID=A0A1R1PZK5_ZANCU|nr:putative peroxisomal acyl-coenzyme A oxidase [Zancudomyces culisetae]|eukprot:OMH86369.1 putative peroxisomal acyl-coenzyme A oxidase [Zancudomyces culisetae]
MLFPKELKVPEPSPQTTLNNERKNGFFPVEDMGLFINGEEAVAKREKVLKIVRAEPEIFGMKEIYHMSRTEKIEHILKQELRMVELLREDKLTSDDMLLGMSTVIGLSGPYRLTRSMFIPTLEKQCTEEQREVFLKPALDYRIIGCYAQTEMGHGSNIRSLETTATFIEETGEFELNSPTLTSTKWWIGSLGVACTHACVIAQLIVKGKNYGIFPFVVPIRSTVDHKPLPGVYIGDIGPKFGVNVMDNGYLHLNYVVRIKGADPRMTYISMAQSRTGVASGMGVLLARAVTVVTRYTAVRRQFGKVGKLETPVIDYGIVWHRIIPLIAQAYVMIGMTHELKNQFVRTTDAIAKNDFSLLKEMHATSAGLKKWSTTISIYGIDTFHHVLKLILNNHNIFKYNKNDNKHDQDGPNYQI